VLRDWCRASIATFESQRPDAEVVALDGANHHVFLSEPEGTARRLRAFLGKL
jgi:pimeloyl-ACP methyl ester carboxylesterase